MDERKSDLAIMRAICELMIVDTDGELNLLIENKPELLTQRAVDLMRIMAGDIPAGEIKDEWEKKAGFLEDKIKINFLA